MAEPYMQMLARRSLIGMASESTTPGTNAYSSVTTALAQFAYDAIFKLEDAVLERMPQGPYGGTSMAAVVSQLATLTFKQEIAPSDSFLSNLLFAGFQNSAGTRKPVTVPANQIAASIKNWRDGAVYRMYGAVADLTIDFETGKPAMANWSFKGNWSGLDTDASMPSDNVPSALPFPVTGVTCTVNSATPPRWKRSQIKLNNKITAITSQMSPTGVAYFEVVDRRITWSFDFESRKKADLDAHGLVTTETEHAIALTLTRGANTIVFTAPKAQRIQIDQTDDEGLLRNPVVFALNKSSGDDELQITVT